MSIYSIRDSTKSKTEQAHKRPLEGNGRKILPIEATPSITVTGDERKVDKDVSGVKAAHRIYTYYVNALAEALLGTPFARGKTDLQGARAPKGWQAAHGSLAPNTLDTFTQALINGEVTPRKSKSFLKSRFDLAADEENSRALLLSRLPADGEHSVLEGTRYSWHCNATFDNPDESNQYDSQMERTLAPFLNDLSGRRMRKELTAEASTEELVKWLMNYYQESIANLQNRLQEIEDFARSFENMRKFELQGSQQGFEEYVQEVGRFLALHDSLVQEQKGCPTTSAFSACRNDFKFLRKLYANPSLSYYLENRRHLSAPMQFDKAYFREKYDLYLEEVSAQKDSVEQFTYPCAIPNLSKGLFGVCENGIRRAPTENELKEQLFGLFKLATPVKAKIQKRNDENAPPFKKRKLEF